MKKLVLAMERASLSAHAVRLVEDCLSAWPQAQLIVLHVIPEIRPDSVYPYYSLLSREVGRENALVGEIEEAVQNRLFPDFKDRILVTCVIGSPVHGICDFAHDEGADLIVLDGTNPSAIDRLLLGSVSYGVVHHAKVPVLLVKHAQAEA